MQLMLTSICWQNKREVEHAHVWSPIGSQ